MAICIFNFSLFIFHLKVCGNSSVGRAAASQAAGHEFEPRLPLKIKTNDKMENEKSQNTG